MIKLRASEHSLGNLSGGSRGGGGGGGGGGGAAPHLFFSEIAHFLLSAGTIFAEFNIHSEALRSAPLSNHPPLR